MTNPLIINPLEFQPDALAWFTRLEKPKEFDDIADRKYKTNREIVIALPFKPAWPPSDMKPYTLVKIYPPVHIMIPKGFYFDGASGPASDRACNLLAALVHDALYYLKRKNAIGYSWRQADKLYRDIMLAQGSGLILAYTHYLGLRCGGWVWRMFF